MEGEHKYIYTCLKTTDGEREYYHKAVYKVPIAIDQDDFVDNLCKNFWGGDPGEWDEDKYAYRFAEITCEVYDDLQITEEQYNILKDFL